MSDATPPPPPQEPYAGATQLSPADEKLWATLIHLGGLLWVVSVPVVPALVGYLILKDKGPFIRSHSATALNFQISMLIYAIVSAILIVAFIGFVLLPVVFVLNVVFSIIAAIKANQGQPYSYPMSIKFVS